MQDLLTLKTRKDEKYVIISVDGYINHKGGELIAEECDKWLNEGYKNIILNLHKSNVVNSIGISIILEVIEKVIQLNGKLVFINLDPGIDKTFSIMGLFHYALKANSEEEAVLNFG